MYETGIHQSKSDSELRSLDTLNFNTPIIGMTADYIDNPGIGMVIKLLNNSIIQLNKETIDDLSQLAERITELEKRIDTTQDAFTSHFLAHNLPAAETSAPAPIKPGNKTPAELRQLFEEWKKDPCYDLYSIEGYEAYTDQLKLIQEAYEAGGQDTIKHLRGLMHNIHTVNDILDFIMRLAR